MSHSPPTPHPKQRTTTRRKSHLESRLRSKLDQRQTQGTLRTILPPPPPASSPPETVVIFPRRDRVVTVGDLLSRDRDGNDNGDNRRGRIRTRREEEEEERTTIDFSSNDYLGLSRCNRQLTLVENSFSSYLHNPSHFNPLLTVDSSLSHNNENDNSTLPSTPPPPPPPKPSSINPLLPKLGSTGSRLLSGNTTLPRTIETHLASLHSRPDALLFNSGYDANLSLLGSIPIRGVDVVIVDELVHNSVIVGIRSGRDVRGGVGEGGGGGDGILRFRHNDVGDLRCVLRRNAPPPPPQSSSSSSSSSSFLEGGVIIVVESVYSMDGDVAPLRDVLEIAEEFGADVVVDEAHGLGVYGWGNGEDLVLPEERQLTPRRWRGGNESEGGGKRKDVTTTITTVDAVNNTKPHRKGRGLGVLSALGLQNHPSLLATTYTFGKAAGCHGAAILASSSVIHYLVNYARPFVYSTALPPHSLVTIGCAYRSMVGEEGERRRRVVFGLVAEFRVGLLEILGDMSSGSDGGDGGGDGDGGKGCRLLPSPSPIQALVVPGNERCAGLARKMREVGRFDVYPIRSPTVPRGAERIRIILHYHNTRKEVRDLVLFLGGVLRKDGRDGGGGGGGGGSSKLLESSRVGRQGFISKL